MLFNAHAIEYIGKNYNKLMRIGQGKYPRDKVEDAISIVLCKLLNTEYNINPEDLSKYLQTAINNEVRGVYREDSKYQNMTPDDEGKYQDLPSDYDLFKEYQDRREYDKSLREVHRAIFDNLDIEPRQAILHFLHNDGEIQDKELYWKAIRKLRLSLGSELYTYSKYREVKNPGGAKGRHRRLSPETVKEIRDTILPDEHGKYRNLRTHAANYKISPQALRNILNYEIYK